MKILIGADLVPSKANREAFGNADVQALVDPELEKLLREADYRVFNLEIPLADQRTPIPKCGPNMLSPTACGAGIQALGADLLTLANNHILDHGVPGLRSTMETLDSLGIAYTGAGDTPQEAAEPFVLEREGMKIGFYCCAEHEFSIVKDGTPGANPFDPLWSLDHIQALKQRCDYVIVLYHGGKEYYRYPSPELQRVCRRIAEKGADLVLCQHSHCVGCQEVWNGATIVYGQGNFLFASHSDEFWASGLLVGLELTREKREITFHPLEQRGAGVALAVGEKAEQILTSFQHRSRQILEAGFVEENFGRFAEEGILEYYGRSLGRVRYILFRAANLLCADRLHRYCYSRKDMLALQNLLKCEAHREIYFSGLERILAKRQDKKK